MNLKQKILGLGLAAILNSCSDNVSHFTYAGEIMSINRSHEGKVIVDLENHNTGSTATAYLSEDRMPEELKEKLELGRRLWLQDCDSSLTNGHYSLQNCNFYK